jgi:hypothetical protein
MLMILLIVLLLMALGGLPTWGFHSYGYGPSGVLGLLLVILIVWMLVGGRFR